ncbi:UNVERIFIED_CONTAM: Retrovirus-related Pol polyprotein from transposon TNT 1-94 [Sesamum radiatum]|uniref:Retrovirus-related Pol polyprotein from transposon TNT 1-94 n=1 Tax=Sesamum radiatum TaxID=300843 RepID=A0AAW2IXN0_SESRA
MPPTSLASRSTGIDLEGCCGLTQSSYIEKVLKIFKMEHSKRGLLPSMCTRPDVAYALNVTSRYQARVGEAHWGAVKSILKYLKRIKDMFLIYGGGELILEGYRDASFQSDEDDAKSQSYFVFKLNGGVVAWKSSKQDTTTIPPRKLNTSQLRKLPRRQFG